MIRHYNHNKKISYFIHRIKKLESINTNLYAVSRVSEVDYFIFKDECDVTEVSTSEVLDDFRGIVISDIGFKNLTTSLGFGQDSNIKPLIYYIKDYKSTDMYRVGRNQNRVIMDIDGNVIADFKKGFESLAKETCDYLNKKH